MDDFEWLEQWYAEQCDGDWEHQNGVKVETLDNPGRLLTVDLLGTSLATRTPGTVARSGVPPGEENAPVEAAWMDCQVRDGKFVGAGDAGRLRDLLAAFRSWVSDGDARSLK
jgi:hypothetical protein